MKKPELVFVRMSGGGHARNIDFSRNIGVGLPLLDASDVTLTDLNLSFNKSFGPHDGLRLGDVFGAKIHGNIADVRLPAEIISEMKAAKTAGEKRSFLQRMAGILTKPTEIEALTNIAEKVWDALPS